MLLGLSKALETRSANLPYNEVSIRIVRQKVFLAYYRE